MRQPDAFVFGHWNGTRRRSIRTAWDKACRAAGIEGLQVRGMRPTAATRIQEGGATWFDVKLHLGHSARALGDVTARYVDPDEPHRRRIAELTIRHQPSNVVELRPRKVEEDSTASTASGNL